MCRILITGASGVLASKIAEKLNDDFNYQVFCASRSRKYDSWITNSNLLTTDFLKQIDIVLHCAFPRVIDEKSLKEGRNFLTSLLQRCREQGVKNFINISSQDVYGTFRETASLETSPTNPENEYAMEKLTCELLGLNFACGVINYTNIRLGSLIGIEYEERIINKMIKYALANKEIIVQHSNNVFNFLDVQDAAEGLINFIKNTNPANWNNTYNLGQVSKVRENTLFIANCIKKICKEKGLEVKINLVSTDANISRLLNSDSFYRISNWQPKISLESSIKYIFDDIYAEFLLNGGNE